MKDEDVLAFGQIAEIHGHELIEFDKAASFHVFWNPQTNAPFIDEQEGSNFLYYSESKESVLEAAAKRTEEWGWGYAQLLGTAEHLSDTPLLLEKLIETTPDLVWNQQGSALCIENIEDPEAINALNGLLKIPLFALREMDIEQLIELEKRLN